MQILGSTNSIATNTTVTIRPALTVVGQFATVGNVPLIVSPQASPLAFPGTSQTGIFSVETFNTQQPGSPTSYTQGFHMRFMTVLGNTSPGALPFDSTSSMLGSITTGNPSGGSGTNYNTSSDHRLKENVTPVENGLDYIIPLRPRKFTWKQAGTESIGFIAHELYDDYPQHLNNLVVGEKDATKTMVSLYKDGEQLLNSYGEPILRELPILEEADRISSEGYTWVVVKEEPILQSIDPIGLISPLVSSVQQLKNMIDEQEKEIVMLQTDVEFLERVK
jgi:hypothetical protein